MNSFKELYYDQLEELIHAQRHFNSLIEQTLQIKQVVINEKGNGRVLEITSIVSTPLGIIVNVR